MDTMSRKRTRKTSSSGKEKHFKGNYDKPLAGAGEKSVIMEGEFNQYYYSLVESIPVPEPTWSTTAPAVQFADPPELEPPADVVELVWGENESFSSVEAWWVEFLKSLDCKSKGEVGNYYNYNNHRCGGGGQENVVAGESGEAAATVDAYGTFPEEWLCFPTEEHGDEPAAAA